MRCPYCHGPLCRVHSQAEDKKNRINDGVLWRCIVCGADTRHPKRSQRLYSQMQLLGASGGK